MDVQSMDCRLMEKYIRGYQFNMASLSGENFKQELNKLLGAMGLSDSAKVHYSFYPYPNFRGNENCIGA